MNNPIFKAIFFLSLVVIFTFAARLARDFIRLCQGKDLRFSVQGMEGLERMMLSVTAFEDLDLGSLDDEEKQYLVTAWAMPYGRVSADIEAHNVNQPAFSGGRLLDILAAKYDMDEPTVARRLREVRAMMRANITISKSTEEAFAA